MTLEQQYAQAMNNLFASLQAVKYNRACPIDDKIRAVKEWRRYLADLERLLIFKKHNPPKEIT